MILELDKNNFENEIKEGLVLVDFWAPWCTNCRMLMPFIEKLEKERSSEIKVCKVNASDQTELADRFSISTLPTLIFFKNGEMVEQHIGFKPYGKLIEIVDNLK